MNKSLNVALAIVLAGTASLAVAQSPEESSNADMSSLAAMGTVNVAGDTVKSTLAERIASFLIVGAGRTRVR